MIAFYIMLAINGDGTATVAAKNMYQTRQACERAIVHAREIMPKIEFVCIKEKEEYEEQYSE